MCPNSQNQRSPYIIGTVIRNIDQLFGREIILRTIADSLQQDAKFILLHGQRRIGKSSILQNIHHFVSPDEFVFVSCDFQEHGHATLGQILYAIAKEIFDHLNLEQKILNPLLDINADLRSIRRIVNNKILPPIDEALNNKKLVLLLDEFDVINQNDTEQAVEFLRFLEDLVRQQEYLFVIAVVGRYLNAMPNLVQSFRNAPFYEIGLLDNNDAQRLIIQPAGKILEYQEKTIAEILKVSSGHPFCTQVLCHEIFQLVRNQNNPTNPTIVVPNYVVEVIPNAIESAGGGLDSIWKGLSISEKVVMLAVAEAQNSHTIQNPLKLLESYGLVLTNSLEEAIQLLVNKGFLDSNPVKIKVELVRLWLVQRHLLRDKIRSLETLEEENINQLLFVARSCWMGDKQQDAALAIYEQALQLNPNHFSTIVELAEKYLQLENFDKALKLYDRVYKLDRIGYQEELIKTLDQYGHWLITQSNYIAAKQQYEKILQIQPGNSLSQNKLAEIKAYQNNNNNKANLIQQFLRLPIVLLILGLIGGGGSLIIYLMLVNSCPAGQEFFVVFPCPNTIKISRGDRTLFPGIQNSDRDKGIESFKKGNYLEAENYFKKAFADNNNRPDPEVLIYQNNALARQQENSLILAVVVPARNRTDAAQEILRGIAQAQNQFNQQGKGGLNDRLLEIVIADDENKEDIAKRIAEELVKDKSILGVIGHASSHVTDAVLQTYTDANLAVISPTSSSTKFQSPVFFRTVNSNKVTGENLAEYARKINLKKVVIFCNPNDSYSNTMREEFRVKFMANLGTEIVGGGEKCIHNLADSHFNVDKEVRNIFLDTNPAQAIILFPDTQHLENAGLIAKAHKVWIDEQQKAGNNIQKLKLLGGDVLYNKNFLDKYSDALEGLVLSISWFHDAQNSKDFAQKAHEQWGGDVSWRTATSFDATQAFLESFKLSSNPSQPTVLDNLLRGVEISSSNTSGEKLKLDRNTRETKREETLIVFKNRKFVIIPEPNLGKLNKNNLN
jgi:ABC-type branched-subunit amino acid transport system substrate-binding protein